MTKYPLNCWKNLKLYIPQHSDETCASVTVTKVERNIQMAYGQILSAVKMVNQQLRPEQGKVQRLSATKR